MTAIVGADGDISLPTVGGVLQSWQATVEYVLSETTGFAPPSGTSQHRRFAGGLLSVSGSASGICDATTRPLGQNTGLPAPGGSLTLTAQGGNTWAFTSIFPAVTLNIDKVGDSAISFDFTNGDADDFAETWA